MIIELVCLIRTIQVIFFFNERLYLTDKDIPNYVFAKNTETGWFVNEIPFYWQHTKALGYTAEELLEDDRLKMRWEEIPRDTIKNLRDTYSKVSVDLTRGKLDFETNLYLKGQFSTLTRGVYLNNELDSTINPNYGNKIYELPGRVFLIDEAIIALNAYPPFTAHHRFKYYKEQSVIKSNELYRIPLSEFFNFVMWDGMDFEHRASDYYPDFGFNDFFQYEFEFDEPVTLEMESESYFENEYGSFGISVAQSNDTTITLVAEWFLTGRSIPAKKIHKLKDFYNGILDLNKEEIIFRNEN